MADGNQNAALAAEGRLPVMFANVALLRALDIAKRRKCRDAT